MIRRQMNKLVMAVVERDLAVALIRREQVVLEVILRELVVVMEAVAVEHHRQARPVEVVVEAVVLQEEEVVVETMVLQQEEVVVEAMVLQEEEVVVEAVDLGEPMKTDLYGAILHLLAWPILTSIIIIDENPRFNKKNLVSPNKRSWKVVNLFRD